MEENNSQASCPGSLPLSAPPLPLSSSPHPSIASYLTYPSSDTGPWNIGEVMGAHFLLDQLPLEMLPVAPPLPPQQGRQEQEAQEEQEEEEEEERLGPVKEMMYRIASMQPVDIDPATIRRPKRRNVHISDDPQSTAARRRRERISERIRILQRLVPGGTKLDTASMLDEAVRYIKYLKRQVQILQKKQQPGASAASSAMAAPASFGELQDGAYERLHLPFT